MAERNEAYLDPPSSLAIAAETNIRAPLSRAGNSLTAKTEYPKKLCINQAIHPINGGTDA